MPRRPHLPRTVFTALALSAIALAGCDNTADKTAAAAAAPNATEAAFDAIVARCTQSVADRTPTVRAGDNGQWVKVGHSPALVQREVTRTESPITPYVGKIVIKDNEARATATTEAEARAITLTPAHLLSNRTHTFVYSFDGEAWRWNNGSLFTKTPSQSDTTVALTLAEVSATGTGFGGCLPH